jgi:hypothetical protein
MPTSATIGHMPLLMLERRWRERERERERKKKVSGQHNLNLYSSRQTDTQTDIP